MDRIRARVDEHDARFKQLESRTSEMEDQRHGERERLLQMERVLEVIRNKNEVLELSSGYSTAAHFISLRIQNWQPSLLRRFLGGLWLRNREILAQSRRTLV
ncbi:hypothetical protein NDU88_012738 [Pleurodeles waltl]|uniref:Uncharacterized protein n=1 Tax=Pleurodeles waltl TaxID=8319 RepID=A0AAV7R6Y6_PLEWA|nr:hypothetical protein NDU88_012738 [Pleurodeles waltl]